MTFKVFYAWQSGRPNAVCRRFIRQALDAAKIQLENDFEIDDSVRDRLVVDQDTQGIPGSPPIVETILSKIRDCNAFVADLTYTHLDDDKSPAPNPNVLLEYGYALHARGHQRIIGVFNEAYGDPENLPFDLRHRRWPIRYRLHEDDSQELRKKQLSTLVPNLVYAIRSIIAVFAESESTALSPTSVSGDDSSSSPDSTPAPATDPSTLYPIIEHFPWNAPMVRFSTDETILFRDAPSLFLVLRARSGNLALDNGTVLRIAHDSLHPLASSRADGWSYGRTRFGAGAFVSSREESSTALTASHLARNGSLHGIDRYHLRVSSLKPNLRPYIPTGAVEEVLLVGLENFLSVAKHQLHLEPPIDIVVGLEGVQDYRLAVDHTLFDEGFTGRILAENVETQFVIDSYNKDPFELLLPFFEQIYDAAGRKRPSPEISRKRNRLTP